MERVNGRIRMWDDERGFGFILPEIGGPDVFLHITEIPHNRRRPEVGDRVTYRVEVDDEGRPQAIAVKPSGFTWSAFTMLMVCAAIGFGLYIGLLLAGRVTVQFVSVYVGMSLLTIWAYRRDKRAARAGLWRTSEATLHLFEFLGGWPGALLAQIFYRHKSRKLNYQIVFWLIVAGHGVFWYFWWPRYAQIQADANATLGRMWNAVVTWVSDLPLPIRKFQITAPPTRVNVQQAAQSEIKPTRTPTIVGSRNQDVQELIVEGTLAKIDPQVGLIIALPKGSEGIVSKSKLAQNFATAFREGMVVRVKTVGITITDGRKQIELVLVR